MTEQPNSAERDNVLFAFQRACPRPTASDVTTWCSRYEEFAEDIIEHAAIMRDLDAQQCDDNEEIDPVLFARGRSNVQHALHKARSRVTVQQTSPDTTFDQLMAAASTSIPQLSTQIGIKRTVLSAMVSGRMRAPVGERLLQPFLNAVNATRAQFDMALEYALANPRLGMAKAGAGATFTPRSYEEIIQTSGMSAEECAYWLGEV